MSQTSWSETSRPPLLTRSGATDITYVDTAEGWLYLCVVLDLYSGVVVGWSMSPTQDRHLVLQAVVMALWQREGRQPVVLHSDRGCQFYFERVSTIPEGSQPSLLDECGGQLC